MPKLVSIAEVWQARAQVAEQAAAELEALTLAVGRLARTNYFGADCVEGAALFDQVGLVLDSWRSEVAVVVASLEVVAGNCHSALNSYGAADELGARGTGR